MYHKSVLFGLYCAYVLVTFSYSPAVITSMFDFIIVVMKLISNSSRLVYEISDSHQTVYQVRSRHPI